MSLAGPVIKDPSGILMSLFRGVPFAYGAILFAMFFAFLATQAIQTNDTDLWYHLHGGRYLFEHGVFYTPFLDSYLESEERPYTVYFWGFQALTYLIWSIAGESGLVALKAAGLLLTGYIAMRVILGDRKLSEATFLQLVIITAVVGLLAARGFSLRPHIASYVFIVLFIHILGRNEKAYPLLPVLTIAWVNLHGVEYIVGALICGAFFLQRLSDWVGAGRPQQDWVPMAWIALCAPAVLINPFGYHLITTPFLHSPDLSLFISELDSFDPTLTVDLRQGLSTNILLLLFMGTAGYSALVCLGNFRKHIAALILAIGGLILLTRAQRFLWEWLLLTLPLISAAFANDHSAKHNITTAITLAMMLVGLAVNLWPDAQRGIHYFPFDRSSVPTGTTEFIRSKKLLGRYAVPPTYTGYTEFVLSPHVKFHMDMQFPPFTDEDYYQFSAAQHSERGLRTYIARYSPDMIGVRKNNTEFPDETAKELGYLPVFYDDKLVLFLKAATYPEVTQTYRLNVIDPFNSLTFSANEVELAIEELRRMLKVTNVAEIKRTLLNLLIHTGNLDEARTLRDELLTENHYHPTTRYLSARLDHLTGNCASAVKGYKGAIAIATEDVRPMHRLAAECYFILNDPRSAYHQFSQGLNPYVDTLANKLQYYQFALSAIGAEEEEHALRILSMLETLDPEGEYSERIDSVRRMLKR